MTVTELLPSDTKGAEYSLIPISHLRPHKANVRFALRDVDSMAASILELGILEPLVVIPGDLVGQTRKGEPRDPNYRVVLGHRRLAGAIKAGLDKVPCIIRFDLEGQVDAIAAMLAENLERDSLTPIEQAAAYEQLGLLGASDLAIAKMVGRDPKEVTSRRQLMSLPAETRARIVEKQLDLDEAAQLAKYADDPAALKFLEPHMGGWNFEYKLRAWPEEKKKREAKAADAAEKRQIRTEHKAAVKAAKAAGEPEPPMPAALVPAPKADKPSWQVEQEKNEARRERITAAASLAADVRLAWIQQQLKAVAASRAKVTLPPFVRGLLNMAIDNRHFDDDVWDWLGLPDASLPVDKLTDLQAAALLACSEARIAQRFDSGWGWSDKNDSGSQFVASLVTFLGYPISDDEQKLAAGKVK